MEKKKRDSVVDVLHSEDYLLTVDEFRGSSKPHHTDIILFTSRDLKVDPT